MCAPATSSLASSSLKMFMVGSEKGVLWVLGAPYAFLNAHTTEVARTRDSGDGLPFSAMWHALVATSLEKEALRSATTDSVSASSVSSS